MAGIKAASPCTPSAGQPQSAAGRVQDDQSKALDVMKQMVTGQVSAKDGMKALQSLVVDTAKATGVLPDTPDKGAGKDSAPPTGYSMTDSFDSGKGAGAKPLVALDDKPKDTSFLSKESGGGSKPGIGSGTN
jgi:hypothetical protein